MEAGRAPLDRPVGVPEPHDCTLARNLPNALDRIDEVHMPGRAAELAVSGAQRADVGLHPDDIGDRLVLDRTQLGGVDLAGREAGARGVEIARPEEAADVVSPKRRPAGIGHVGQPCGVGRTPQLP
jgi:hypothetical protein